MYIGYNLNLPTDLFDVDDTNLFYNQGKALYEADKSQVHADLGKFFNNNGSLSGAAMEEAWFPQIKADVFISHSHLDEKLAISLAGLLNLKVGLNTFIDSCIWSYADDLLLMIDKEYCKRDDGYYSYEKRNYSTSHVHMMLNTALMKMMDKTECIIFLNTPASISTSEVTNNTKSPWIYSEISMTRMLRRTNPSRQLQELNKGDVTAKRNLQVEYAVDLDHLIKLEIGTMMQWINGSRRGPAQLDTLYDLAGGRPKTKIIDGYFTK